MHKTGLIVNRNLNRRDFLKLVGGSVAAAVVPCFASAAGKRAEKKLNFVFFLIDDMGWKDLGCYGSTFYETPNIDSLAAEGMRFTDAYAACPVCSPTRASIMTGKYPARLNLTDYLVGKRRGKLIPADYIRYLPLEEVTIAEALKKAGYDTCYIGKWHLGWLRNPEKQGFDVNIGNRGGAAVSYFAPYRSTILKDSPKGEYLTDRLTDEAVKFLDGQKGKAKPFFLYLAHYAVHTPIQAKEELIAKYKAKAEKLSPVEGPKFILAENQARFADKKQQRIRQIQSHPVYAAMIQSLDESIGQVLDKLKELGVADNTVVIFMSDNGGLSTTGEGAPTSNVPLRAGKGWLYEGGIRVPMIIKWPRVVKPNSVCNVPVTSTDFYPTMLEMAGLEPKLEQHIDGVGLAGLLRGGKSLDRKAIFWHYPHYGNQGGIPGGTVRAGDYKLIEFYEDNHVELYNLKEDIGEKHNLAAERPYKVIELQKMLHHFRQAVDARMPARTRNTISRLENNSRE